MINLSLKNFFRCTEFDVSWGATAFVSDVHEERNCYKFEWQGASLNSDLKRKDGKIGIIIKEITIVINIILNILRFILGACIINPCWISDFISIISLCLLKYLRDCFPFRDRWNASVTFFWSVDFRITSDTREEETCHICKSESCSDCTSKGTGAPKFRDRICSKSLIGGEIGS